MPPANFTPEMGSYKTLQPFRYWCQKILPLVYDDSLSYYELLCKVVDYLNKTMEDVETLHVDTTKLHMAYEELQNYVNTYFSSLDVQQEINTKLDEYVTDGTLSRLLSSYSFPVIADSVESMTNHNKVYYNTQTGTLYNWNGKTWVDTGLRFEVPENLIIGLGDYNDASQYGGDLNLFPENITLTINVDVSKLKNSPNGSSGSGRLITFNPGESNYYGVQLLFTSNNGVYSRVSYGRNRWTEWTTLNNQNDKIFLKAHNANVTASAESRFDLNSVPEINRIYNITGTEYVDNKPIEHVDNLRLICFTGVGYPYYGCQLLHYVVLNRTFFRSQNGKTIWTKWSELSNINNDLVLSGYGSIINNETLPLFNDLDTFPINTIQSYSGYSSEQVSNLPIRDGKPHNFSVLYANSYTAKGYGFQIVNYSELYRTFIRNFNSGRPGPWCELTNYKWYNDSYYIKLTSKKIALLSDSIGVGYINGTEITQNNWIKQLSTNLNFTYNNFSVGGAGLAESEGYRDLNYMAKQITNEDIVIVCLGVNDYARQIDITNVVGAITTFASYINGLSDKPEVLFITPFPVNYELRNNHLDAYREAIAYTALINGFNVIDGSLAPFPSNNVYSLLTDGVHPTQIGYNTLARWLSNKLK